MFAPYARGHRRILAARIAAAAAFLCLAPAPLHAADRFWILSNQNGLFGSTVNWSLTDDGPGSAGVPGAADIANFTLEETHRPVEFNAGHTNLGLDVQHGNVTFDLKGFTYTLLAGGVDVGALGGPTASLTVGDGILAVGSQGDQVRIGSSGFVFTSSAGFLTVTTGGRLGNGTIRPEVEIGDNGTGTLTVNDNGRADVANIITGIELGSTGTVSVAGPNAVVNVSGTLSFGSEGTGTLSVTNGGTLTTTGTTFLGVDPGGEGAATVSGIGSTLTLSGESFIGNRGHGALTVSAGGLLSTSGPASVGTHFGGSGTLTVTGANSRWELTSTQTIGANAQGVLTVAAGGQVVSTSSATVGMNANREGRVTVTGAGSRWALDGSITLGSSGAGELNVLAGGEASASGLILGNVLTGIGVATVTGAGSRLTTTGDVTVAASGFGTLNVGSGAEVYVASNLVVNNPAAAPLGTLNLDGGSVFVAGNFVNTGVLAFTDGLLQVTGGFQPGGGPAPLLLDGVDNGDLPTLDLIGAGTTTNVTALTVASDRRGRLLLRHGRVLNLGANPVNIGSRVGGEGTIDVQSGAQLLTTSNLAVGGGGTAGGTGTLNITGGTVDAATLRLFPGGTVNLNGGTLAVDMAPVLDGQFNWTGGTLRFDAAFSLTSTNVPKLLGLDATLDSGQALTSNAGIPVTLQTPLIVDGGTLNASSLINQSRLEVRSGSIGAVQNDGLLLGDGTISNAVSNNATGKIRVDAGKTLFFNGTFAPNAGELNLQGGTLDFTGAITNSASGYIAGRGALYSGGLTNNGAMAFSGGNMDVHGDVTNAAGARIVTSGGGATTTFFDDVTHNGTEIFTGAGASTVIFGALSGAGPFTGTGAVYSIGDLRPGNSPAAVSFGGSLVLGGSTTLSIELGGLAAGTQYDRLVIAGSVSLAGTLAVSLIDAGAGLFEPEAGDAFDILDWGNLTGTFAAIQLPSLSGGLQWNTSQLYSAGVLSVVPALEADFDEDGDVDGADFLIWQRQLGLPSAVASSTAVPEPMALALAAALGLSICGVRLSSRRHRARFGLVA